MAKKTSKQKVTKARKKASRAEPINSVHQEIVDWIHKLKFKKTMFGGVKEADVLKKMEELNALYEKALLHERARYEALLNQQRGGDIADESRSDTTSTG